MEDAMDASRFDAWTRRRLGWAAGGLATSLFNLSTLDGAAAKKKKKRCKKIRCKTELQSCDPDIEKERCCLGLNCDVFGEQPGLRCCLGLRSRCLPGDDHCCSELLCAAANGLEGNRCCADITGRCSQNEDCCGEAICGQGGCLIPPSDRALKANFGSVDPADMLARVRELPIATWNYTSDDPAVRHIGPMAQDFAAAFGVGADDRHIHPIDGQGVALAAIQGLVAELDHLRKEHVTIAERIAALEDARE
jgi:hypothetical protein